MHTDDRTGELSPRSAFGMPPLGAISTSPVTELPRSVFKHNQWKDRIAGGGSLPLAATAEERKIAHFLDLFAQGNCEAIHESIAQGASADSTDSGGSNGLHYAARGANLDGVKLAVSLGLSISSANNGGFQAIHYASLQAASEKKLTDVLQWLVMAGADLSARTSSGLTAAELAGDIGHCELVAEWLELHARTPKWIPSKETLDNGGRSDRIFKPPCTGVCSYAQQTIH